MRVRGSFYLAKAGKGGFGTGTGNNKSKSPRGSAAMAKKVSPAGRLGYPKKKAKLKLEPLGHRGFGIRGGNQNN